MGCIQSVTRVFQDKNDRRRRHGDTTWMRHDFSGTETFYGPPERNNRRGHGRENNRDEEE